MPSIGNEDCKRKDRDSESACADLQPHLTTVQTAIWLERSTKGDRSCVRFQGVRIFARFSSFMSGIYSVNFRNEEAISALGNGLDVAGTLGIIAKRLP